ncbi:hypothetical protein D3C71_1716230 [compost metagenome]
MHVQAVSAAASAPSTFLPAIWSCRSRTRRVITIHRLRRRSNASPRSILRWKRLRSRSGLTVPAPGAFAARRPISARPLPRIFSRPCCTWKAVRRSVPISMRLRFFMPPACARSVRSGAGTIFSVTAFPSPIQCRPIPRPALPMPVLRWSRSATGSAFSSISPTSPKRASGMWRRPRTSL